MLNKDRLKPSRSLSVQFEFRTYAEDGLMFVLGQEKEGVEFLDFFAVEMRGGKIQFRFDLGSGRLTPLYYCLLFKAILYVL